MTKNLRTQELTELSLNKLFHEHWKIVYLFAKKKTKDHQKAEDLTNDTFIKAFRSYKSFDPNKSFSPWIIAICKNIYIDNWRKTKNKDKYIDDQAVFVIEDPSPLPDKQMILDEEYTEFLRLIDFLNEAQKQIITLYYLDNLSYEEISVKFSISQGTARQRLSRAKNNLINALRPLG